jgi:hypothetical protein
MEDKNSGISAINYNYKYFQQNLFIIPTSNLMKETTNFKGVPQV